MKFSTLISIAFSLLFLKIVGQNNIEISNLKNINTQNSDFGVNFYKGDTIVFSSAKRNNYLVKKVWQGNKQPFLNLFYTTKNNNGNFKVPELFSKSLNSRFHEASVTFSPDFSVIYFTRNNFFKKKKQYNANGVMGLKIYKAVWKDEKWSDVTELPFNSNKYSIGHPAVSKDGKKLFFISDMPGGYGETDVYYVNILSDNSYSEPVNLGSKINTTGKELFPYVDENDNLYFSSDGHYENVGGLDIYMSEFKIDKYLTPILLPVPINSTSDDFAFIKRSKNNYGYFSSNRFGGHGDDDIYSFHGEIIERNCNWMLFGTIKDKISKKPINNISIEVYQNHELIRTIKSDKAGKFNLKDLCEQKQNITLKVRGGKYYHNKN